MCTWERFGQISAEPIRRTWYSVSDSLWRTCSVGPEKYTQLRLYHRIQFPCSFLSFLVPTTLVCVHGYLALKSLQHSVLLLSFIQLVLVCFLVAHKTDSWGQREWLILLWCSEAFLGGEQVVGVLGDGANSDFMGEASLPPSLPPPSPLLLPILPFLFSPSSLHSFLPPNIYHTISQSSPKFTESVMPSREGGMVRHCSEVTQANIVKRINNSKTFK